MAFNTRRVFSPESSTAISEWKSASSSSPSELTSARASEKLRIDISPEDRHAILLSFRVRFFTRWQSVEDFIQAAYADRSDGSKRIDKHCWLRVLNRWEEQLVKPFELFYCLDVDDDGALSLNDVSEALAEVAPEKSVADIQRLFRLTGVHRKRNFHITRSDFATECAVHLDIRPVDAEAFFDAVTSQDTVPFTEIARFVEAGPPLYAQPPSSPSPVTGDLLLVDQADYESGQSVWIRYSVSHSFLGKPALDVPGVGKGISFPLTIRTLLRSPFIAMIPYNAKWSGGGGTGFYDPEKNIQLQTNAVACTPLPLPRKDGVVRLHAPLWPGKYKVAVFRSNGEKYFANMAGAAAECTVFGNVTKSPDPVQHKQQRLSLKFIQLDVKPAPVVDAGINTAMILFNTVSTNTPCVKVAAALCQTDSGVEAATQTPSNNTVSTNMTTVEVVETPCQTETAGMEAECKTETAGYQTDAVGPSNVPCVEMVATAFQTDEVRTVTDVQTDTEGLVSHTPSGTDPITVQAAETQGHPEGTETECQTDGIGADAQTDTADLVPVAPPPPLKVTPPPSDTPQDNSASKSPWWPALAGTATTAFLVAISLSGTTKAGAAAGAGPAPLQCATANNSVVGGCHVGSLVDAATGCLFRRPAEELIDSVAEPATPRRGCQSACSLAQYAQASPVYQDLLVANGAVSAVVGRLEAVRAGDRPTALGLLAALRTLCVNSSLAQGAIQATGGVQALVGLAKQFSSDSLVLSVIGTVQHLLFPDAPSPSASLSLIPSPSLSPSLSPNPSASLSPSPEPSESPANSIPPSLRPSTSPASNQSLSASRSPSPSPSLSQVPSDLPSISVSPLPSRSPLPSTSPGPSSSPPASPSLSSSPSPHPSPSPHNSPSPSPPSPLAVLNQSASVLGVSSPAVHSPSWPPSRGPSPGDGADSDPGDDDDQCWQQCEELADDPSPSPSPDPDPAADDSPLTGPDFIVGDCLTNPLTPILFALFFVFSILWVAAILCAVLWENHVVRRLLLKSPPPAEPKPEPEPDVKPEPEPSSDGSPPPRSSLQRPCSWLLKLLCDHLQVLGLIGIVAVPWPVHVGTLLAALNAVVNVDVNFTAFTCLMGLSDVGRVVVYFCLPLGAAAFAAVFAILWVGYACCRRQMDWRAMRGRFITILLLVSYVIYPISLRHFIAMVTCAEDGVVDCFSGLHLGIVIGSAVYIFAWGVLVPGLALRVLLRPGARQSAEGLDRYGWLFVGYQESAWYWELVVHVRKVAVCVVVASRLAVPTVQMQTILGLVGVALVLHCLVRPHEKEELNKLETYSLWTIFLTAWLGLLYAQAAGKGPEVAISAAVFVLNVLCLLLFLSALWAQFRRTRGLKEDGTFGWLVAVWQFVAAEVLKCLKEKEPEQEHEQEQEPSKPPSPAAKTNPGALPGLPRTEASESRSGVYRSSTPPHLSGHHSPESSDMAPFRGAHSPPLPPLKRGPFLRRPPQLGPLAETFFDTLRSRRSEPGEDCLSGFDADSPVGRSLHTLASPLLRRTSTRIAPEHSPASSRASPPRWASGPPPPPGHGSGGPVEGEAPALPQPPALLAALHLVGAACDGLNDRLDPAAGLASTLLGSK